MKCPHCLEAFHDKPDTFSLGTDADGAWAIRSRTCPTCLRFIVSLAKCQTYTLGSSGPLIDIEDVLEEILCRPKATLRPPPSKDVPAKYANDYVEACRVLPDSAKASAALSRRCLQNIIREVAKVKQSDLAREIQELLDNGKLPSHLAESVDAIRNTGNFAAHPIKSKSSGEIVDVEPGEAEWNLDVLDGLFDFYFVQSAMLKRKREALDKKLADAGKPHMKSASATI